MKKRLYLAVLVLLTMLAAGCQLAQPSRAGSDRFAGYMLAYEYNEMGAGKWSDYLWTTYEGELVEPDPFGTATKEGLIVNGTWNEEEFRYEFPGVKGVGCFLTLVPGPHGDDTYAGYNDTFHQHITVRDDGTTVEGTVYFGPESAEVGEKQSRGSHYVWTPYPVYEREDGSVYMLGGVTHGYGGGGITITESQTNSVALNGERKAETQQVVYHIEWIERIELVEVKQYDEDNVLLSEQMFFTADPDVLTGELHPDADWIAVQEFTADGPGEKTLYAKDQFEEDGSLVHSMILLDDTGMGFYGKIVLRG